MKTVEYKFKNGRINRIHILNGRNTMKRNTIYECFDNLEIKFCYLDNRDDIKALQLFKGNQL